MKDASLTSAPGHEVGSLTLHAIAFSIVATSATQVRLHSLPIGVGEAAMIACICWRWLWRPPADRPFDAGLRSLRLLSIGVVWTAIAAWFAAQLSPASVSDMDNFLSARIVVAIAISALFAEAIFAKVQRPADRSRLYRRIAGWCALLVLASLLAGFSGPAWLREAVWYEGGPRLRALSDNPNQLALLLTFSLSLVALALERTGDGNSMGVLVAAAALVVGGIASGSDAIVLAIAAASIPLMISWVLRAARQPRVATAKPAFVGATVCAALILGQLAVDLLVPVARAVFDEGDQGSDRLALWRSALAFFAERPWFGGGPVPHARLDRFDVPLEAHSLFFDWATMTGAFGLGVLVLGIALALATPVRRLSALHAAPIVAVLVFSLFHFTLRQPVFWLAIAVGLSAITAPVARGTRPCVA